jgi:hypothetical protein
MNQTQLMNMKISNAVKSNEWIELEIHNKYAGKTRIRMNCQLKDAMSVIEKGWSDMDSQRVDEKRLERTGVEMPEGGDIPEEADFILSDWIKGLSLGDDSIKVTPSEIKKYSSYNYGKQIA